MRPAVPTCACCGRALTPWPVEADSSFRYAGYPTRDVAERITEVDLADDGVNRLGVPFAVDVPRRDLQPVQTESAEPVERGARTAAAVA